MKIVSGFVLGLFVALFPPSAMAKDLCLSETQPIGNPVQIIFKAFTVPAKGTCKPISAIVPVVAGLIESGSGCRTSDGNTLLFTLSWGADGAFGSDHGSITLATGSGSDVNFTVSTGGQGYSTNVITVDACPKKPTPITD